MGSGIAQVAAAHGWSVWLMDVDDAVARRGVDRILEQFDRLVEKGRMTAAERNAASRRLEVANAPGDFDECELVIEAIVEDMAVKTRVLRDLITSLRDDCIIASNTSSLSITTLGERIGQPERTVGMHFFNPAPVMKLVEVIAGKQTDSAVADRTAAIAKSWGKVVARAADVPGFIVNHVARPYYLEAFRILTDGLATPDEIDRAMKELGGFRMGPLELTDLIGQDVNAATTRSVWEQLGKPPLLAPAALQEQLVREGHLGRKTKRGVYNYVTDPPAPAITIERRKIDLSEAQAAALDAFINAAVSPTAGHQPPPVDRASPARLSRYVFTRILVAIIAQAHLAFERGVATKEDIDAAMKFGVNYPRGPFEWTAQIGPARMRDWLRVLNAAAADGRFAPPKSLGA
ncbi:MAG: 3-hydroxyacyl-CoA dehydrogenase [Phycisphaeraceae bacterium]|nr:MAG: 3-hydroxyacyl-CoA dehydrogenase [Phycisphaeraceae bacterium]